MIELNINLKGSYWKSSDSKVITNNDSSVLSIKSKLNTGDPAQYLHYNKISNFNNPNKNNIVISKTGTYIVDFKGNKNSELVCTLYVIGYDKYSRIQTEIIYLNKSRTIVMREEIKAVKIAIRIYGEGYVDIQNLSVIKCENIDELRNKLMCKQELSNNTENKYLVLTNIYASDESLYRNAFVHRRIKLYKERGIDVEVFAMQGADIATTYTFDDVKVYSGNRFSLEQFLHRTDYKKILIHFINEDMYEAIKNTIMSKEIIIWIHAIEVESWTRRIFNFDDEIEIKLKQNNQNYIKRNFIRKLFSENELEIKFIFISEFIRRISIEDSGINIDYRKSKVIHNTTDNELFKYSVKNVNQRKKILSIRPFATRNYGNDMTVNCILELSKRDFFNELEFEIYGDGRLHEKTIERLKEFPNITINKGFITQQQISSLYKKYGIFLCPTRWDTQGVSRCEAMSSGMVAITNSVAAVPEFTNNKCSILVDEEDYIGLANGIEYLYKNPKEFLKLSKMGKERVVEQTGYKKVINDEIEIIIK